MEGSGLKRLEMLQRGIGTADLPAPTGVQDEGRRAAVQEVTSRYPEINLH